MSDLLKGNFKVKNAPSVKVEKDEPESALKDKLDQSRQKVIQLEQENSWIDWLSKYHEHYLDWEKFSKEELQDAINQFVAKITVRFDHEKTEHIVTIKFKLPLVDDNLDYKDPDDKSKGYKVGKGNEELQGNLPFKKGGRVSQKNPPLHHHSSVTFVRCDDASSTADLTSNFTLTCRSPALTGNHYSEHQLLLYQTITEHREQGMNFNAIAEWLNNEGYLTVRGKKFRGAHVHSILKKRLVKKELLNREHPPVWSEFSMEVVDKTILMSDFGFPD